MGGVVILKDEKGGGEGEVERIRPDVLLIALLDDMVYKLGSLESVLGEIRKTLNESSKKIDKVNAFLDDTAYKGDTKIVKKTITGDGSTNVKIPITGKWYEYTLANDGPDDAYIESSKKSMSDTSINSGDQITVKSKRGSTKPLWIRCGKGETASVRITYKY